MYLFYTLLKLIESDSGFYIQYSPAVDTICCRPYGTYGRTFTYRAHTRDPAMTYCVRTLDTVAHAYSKLIVFA